MFNIDPKKVGSISDGGGGNPLKVGTFPYEIIEAKLVPDKKDGSGQRHDVLVSLQQGPGYTCREYVHVMSENDIARGIAERTLGSFWTAAGLKGAIKPALLKKLAGKFVNITAVERAGKDKDKPFVNISDIQPYEDETEAEEPEAETEAEEEPEAAEDAAEEEDEPAPKKTRPW